MRKPKHKSYQTFTALTLIDTAVYSAVNTPREIKYQKYGFHSCFTFKSGISAGISLRFMYGSVCGSSYVFNQEAPIYSRSCTPLLRFAFAVAIPVTATVTVTHTVEITTTEQQLATATATTTTTGNGNLNSNRQTIDMLSHHGRSCNDHHHGLLLRVGV